MVSAIASELISFNRYKLDTASIETGLLGYSIKANFSTTTTSSACDLGRTMEGATIMIAEGLP